MQLQENFFKIPLYYTVLLTNFFLKKFGNYMQFYTKNITFFFCAMKIPIHRKGAHLNKFPDNVKLIPLFLYIRTGMK